MQLVAIIARARKAADDPPASEAQLAIPLSIFANVPPAVAGRVIAAALASPCQPDIIWFTGISIEVLYNRFISIFGLRFGICFGIHFRI